MCSGLWEWWLIGVLVSSWLIVNRVIEWLVEGCFVLGLVVDDDLVGGEYY